MWHCCDCKRATKQHERISSKTRLRKVRSLGIKCVSLLDKLWGFFFISNVYRVWMLLWKRFTIFPRNLSWQRSYFRWKLVGLFFCGFRGGNEKFAEIRAGSLSPLAASPLDFAHAAMPRALVLQFSPVLQRDSARRLFIPINIGIEKLQCKAW